MCEALNEYAWSWVTVKLGVIDGRMAPTVKCLKTLQLVIKRNSREFRAASCTGLQGSRMDNDAAQASDSVPSALGILFPLL